MNRRLFVAGLAGLLAGCSSARHTTPAPAPSVTPSPVSPWTLPVATPAPWRAGASRAGRLRDVVTRFLAPSPTHPLFPGGVLFAAVDGAVVAHFAFGDAVRYDAAKAELPAGARIPATVDTLYDLASLTKTFTAVLALRLVEQGLLALDAPAATYLPSFVDKPAITVRMLLTHTSGLSKDVPLVGSSEAERVEHVLREPPVAPAGSGFLYADQNFIALGEIVTRLAGKPLDLLVRQQIAGPLGMARTGFRPPASLPTAATEGGIHGTVHDPSAAAFGGVSGHAGLFATAADVALLGGALLAGGGPLLRPSTVELMRTDANARFGPAAAHGLGVDVDQAWYMGKLAGHGAFGHTGFTGTSMVCDPRRRIVLVLLTNRVHPDATWGNNNTARRAVADAMLA
ncbi:serine hydrolase domain-containing protein [Dactylosporangium sp. NPDC049525]|uniref:serine hydrolase domain-containing protein n=1 Tax=Dactylosporangium sp. NPDC049525 TaxID=3154730 RepID=UPI00343C9437